MIGDITHPTHSPEWWEHLLRSSLSTPYWKWSPHLKSTLTPGRPQSTPEVFEYPKDAWPEAHRIPADVIRRVLIEASGSSGPGTYMDPQGLVISGMYISGELNLQHATLPCAVQIENSQFEKAPNFYGTTVPELSLESSFTPGAYMERVNVLGNCILTYLHSNGTVDLAGSNLGGHLLANHMCIRTSKATKALDLQAASVRGGMFLRHLHVEGIIRMHSVTIGGQLLLQWAKLYANLEDDALVLENACIKGNAHLEWINTKGGIRAHGADISGQLVLDDAILTTSSASCALNASFAKVASSMFLRKTIITGQVVADSMHIRGQFSAAYACIRVNTDETALSLESTRIGESLFLNRVITVGAIKAMGANVGGQLLMSHATVEAKPHKTALDISSIAVSEMSFLDKLFTIGDIYARSARFGGALALTDSYSKSNFDGHALSLESASVTGAIFLLDFKSTGTINAMHAKLEGELILNSGQIEGGLVALDFELSSITTLHILPQDNNTQNSIDLTHAEIGTLKVPLVGTTDQLPRLHGARGWSINNLSGFLSNDKDAMGNWLETIPSIPSGRASSGFSAHPWKEAAKAYDKSGQHTEATWIRHRAARKANSAISNPARRLSRSIFYGWTVGYGYKPLRTILWVLCIYLAALVITTIGSEQFRPTNPTYAHCTVSDVKSRGSDSDNSCNYPEFTPHAYALSSALPVTPANSIAWASSNPWVNVTLATLKMASWALAALFLAGVTGLLRKD